MKAIRYPEGCEMSLYIPMVEMTEGGRPIDTTKLTDLAASVSLHGVVVQITPLVSESCLVLPLGADLKAGQYIIFYSFKYEGRPCSGRWANVLEIVRDNGQSNWQGYLPEEGKAILDDQIFVAGPTMTDEELEQLKAEYRAKIAEEEAIIAEYEQKIHDWEGLAKQGDNPDATNTAILEAVGQIDIGGAIGLILDLYADQIIAISGVNN